MSTGKVARVAGGRWRLLAHDRVGRKGTDGLLYGKAHDITSDPQDVRRHAATEKWMRERSDNYESYTEQTLLAGTEFDELVVGRWIHIEQMDSGVWWMNIGGVTVWVRADRDGRPKRVTVYGPADWATPVEGCEYEVNWTDPPEETP